MEAIGGQALIEGVLMRNKNQIGIAVRKKNGKIKTEKQVFNFFNKFRKIPFLRGIFVLIETLYIGTKALIYSANEAADEGEEVSKKEIFFSILFSFIFAIAFFVLLPLYLTKIFVSGGILFNIIDGLLRVLVFVLYVIGISFMKDIKRVFQYHGAEHKAVNCYEHKKKLTVENTQKFTTLNPRCGTSFILFVILIGVIVFSFVPVVVDALFPQVATFSFMGKRAVFFFTRIIFMLPLAGISYEILKISALYQKNIIFKIISLPGLAVQKMTTSEPTDDQVEVAIKSLEAVLDMETKTHGYEPVELT